MFVGIGTDILLIDRVRRCIDSPSFMRRTFTEAETLLGESRPDPGSYYAKVFAAKEAVFKCFGISADSLGSWRDIEIVDSDEEQPVVNLSGSLAALAEFPRSRPGPAFFVLRYRLRDSGCRTGRGGTAWQLMSWPLCERRRGSHRNGSCSPNRARRTSSARPARCSTRGGSAHPPGRRRRIGRQTRAGLVCPSMA